MSENLDITTWSDEHLVECAEDDDDICKAKFVEQW